MMPTTDVVSDASSEDDDGVVVKTSGNRRFVFKKLPPSADFDPYY